MKKELVYFLLSLPILCNAQNFGNSDKREVESTATLAALQAPLAKMQSVSNTASTFEMKIDTAKTDDAILKTQKSYISNLYKCMDNPFLKNVQFAEGSWLPSYIKYKTGNALIFGNILYASVFNDRILDTRERAKDVVENMADILFLAISENVNNTIPYIGLCIGYCSKDFGDKYGMKKGEAIIVIAPASAIKSYGELSMSEEQFVSKCDYYLIDKNYPSRLRKVELNIFD